jgi:hypothetical protein
MSNTTRRPFAIVDSAPAPQDVFVLEGYYPIVDPLAVATPNYALYKQNPALLSETYTESGASVSQDVQYLTIDPGTVILNVAVDAVFPTGATALAGGSIAIDTALFTAALPNPAAVTGIAILGATAASTFTSAGAGVSAAVNKIVTSAQQGYVTMVVSSANVTVTAGDTAVLRVRLVCTKA